MSSGADLFVVCKTCGSEVSPYITECPYCGSRLRKRAPRLDKEGRPRERRLRRPSRPSLGRLRPGEMPGIRLDQRPYATIALLLAAMGVSIAVQLPGVDRADLALVAPVGDEWWRLLAAPFVYVNTGYAIAAGLGIGLFGWLLERRHGHMAVVAVFAAGAVAGMALAAALESFPAAGGNGAALALLCAWVVPDLRERRRGHETDSDLLGVAVISAVLALLPLAAEEANWLAGAGGAVAGFACGLLLSAVSRER
jgi:membrane associated rhomboid family serine protease